METSGVHCVIICHCQFQLIVPENLDWPGFSKKVFHKESQKKFPTWYNMCHWMANFVLLDLLWGCEIKVKKKRFKKGVTIYLVRSWNRKPLVFQKVWHRLKKNPIGYNMCHWRANFPWLTIRLREKSKKNHLKRKYSIYSVRS